MPTLLLCAGDASGELHAAAFASAFRKRHPDARLVGLGGDAMRAAGVELVADQRDLAIGGLVEVVGGLAGVVRAWRAVDRALVRERPDLVVLVDSGGFNLPLARRVRRRLPAPVLYYVAPQVWAWRTGRIRKLAKRVDRLALILPFEPRVYAGTAVRAEFVGHPLVDAIPRPPSDSERLAARQRCCAGEDERVLTLLPGSRRNEIAAHLALQLEVAARLHAAGRIDRAILAAAPSLDATARERLEARCAAAAAKLPLVVHADGARHAIAAASVVLAKPGTVTLECALLGTPLVVVGRANPVTAWLARRLVRVPSLSMPNLIAEAPLVPEFLQQDARPAPVAAALERLLEGPARDEQLSGLAQVRERLGDPGAAERTCEIAEEMLATARP